MAEAHVVTALRTSTLTGVGRFWTPATPPTVHAFVRKVPRKGGALNVICVGVVEAGKTVWTGLVFTTTRMLLAKKLLPVIETVAPPASGTLDGEMFVMDGLRLLT